MDVIDAADPEREVAIALGIEEARQRVKDIPAGEPGVCGLCGEWSGRLVGAACAPCRDLRGLK